MLNPKHSIKSSRFYKGQPIDQLRFVRCKGVGNSSDSFKYISDIQLLLNSERIQNILGEDGYRAWINSLSPKKSPYEPGKFSDDQLFQNIKSRYVQAPSEMRAWMDELLSQGQDLEKSVNALKELKRQQDSSKKQPAPSVETPKSE